MNLWATSVLIALAVCIANANILCPGAPVSAYGKGELECSKPICLASGGALRPSSNPKKYFVCAGPNLSYEMNCAPGTCFSHKSQGCVHPVNWRDSCVQQNPVEPEVPAKPTEAPVTNPTEPSGDITTKPTEVPATNPTNPTEAPVEIINPTEPSGEITPNPTEVPTEVPATIPTKPTDAPIVDPTNPTEPSIVVDDVPRNVQVCPGSDPVTLTYGDQDCNSFVCTSELKQSNRRWPTKNPQYYAFCFTDSVFSEMRCPGNTCFDYGRQACVDPALWQNYCHGL